MLRSPQSSSARTREPKSAVSFLVPAIDNYILVPGSPHDLNYVVRFLLSLLPSREKGFRHFSSVSDEAQAGFAGQRHRLVPDSA